MPLLLLSGAEIVTGSGTSRRGWLLIDGTHIAQIGNGEAPHIDSAEVIQCEQQIALPGFIDMHVHGAVGFDTMDATPAALTNMAQFYARHGVTGFLATTLTASRAAIRHALENVAACAGPILGGATLLGAHLEGPFLNLAKKGAQPGEYIRRADRAEYLDWLELGVIKQVTVAPEFSENLDFIRDCVVRGINVSIGHTQATYEDVVHAVKLGARQATHTLNAMTGLHHRKPGTVGAVLALDAISCELIADNIHLHPAVLKIVIRAKGIDKTILITDAIMGAGMDAGQFQLGGQAVTVANGMATLEDGSLAGSILTMDAGLRNSLAATSLTAAQAWPMTSANAARQLGLDGQKGRLEVGYDADVVVLNSANEVTLTIAQGQIVYRA